MSEIEIHDAACLLCGSRMQTWLSVPRDWRQPARQSSYSVCLCTRCQFGQLHPRPKKEEIPSFYQVESYYTHQDHAAVGSALSLDERVRVKFAWLNDHGVEIDEPWLRGRFRPGSRVCDLGCGNGGLLERLRRLGYATVGVEPDPDARVLAQKKGFEVFSGTAEELPDVLLGQRFDGVVMSHVLEHCLDPRLAVQNAAGLLADDGVLIIETPNNEAKGLKQAGILWPWLDLPRHLNLFTEASLRKLCEDAKLTVKRVEYKGYTRQFIRSWIENEKQIRDVFAASGTASSELPGPNRDLGAWRLLATTYFSRKGKKYDSVRVIVSPRNS